MPSCLAFSLFVPLTSLDWKSDGRPATLKLSAVNLPLVAAALAIADRRMLRGMVYIGKDTSAVQGAIYCSN